MWNEPDPGGTPLEGPPLASVQVLSDLKEQNEQQQLMIAQLKEMLRKEQSTVPQEKVEEYMNTLSKVNAKKSRTRKEDTGTVERGSSIDSHKKEKLNLLKQQLEENKVKLAERGKSQKGIEDMVIQLKAQLNDTQQQIGPVTTYESKSFDYSKNSSPEELYNILLIKERKITDLITKSQKQEATILDLQENLKEKDSVIDARTKAITLMTDSLSRKGKDTLDALDETKEQMRSMQENFVTLESEMKARQKVLLNDLKGKNLEIAELQELNGQLTQEKNEYLKHSNDSEKQEGINSDVVIKELQEKLDNSNAEFKKYIERIAEVEKLHADTLYDLERLKNTGVTVAPKEIDTEVAKLKKQIEEYNKNMIKVKAQHKSKVKDLTKKLESFKKMNDANALIIELQNENTKLSEKIAELEEEKGNIQLKMVESTDSAKDSAVKDEHKELEDELALKNSEIIEKTNVISSLENDIASLKTEISTLNEKIISFSHLENMQVTSEMNTIQIEEQVDKLTEENSLLQSKIEALNNEKEELNEKIETLIKEKNDLNVKLENYIQENMELIDKLEKLSAEKVSSAESIEIVEGLTHQEKLELAAYQKNIEEPIKCSQEDEILEAPPELNESVMQLTEDSAELLHRIEMFNLERKEVMSRMEELREENNRLSLKVSEIENNRDILAETYEQLQTEKEELQEKYELLLGELQRNENSTDPQKETSTDEETASALLKLQKEYEKLLSENEELKKSVKDFDDTIQEKHNLEKELNASKLKVEDLELKLKENIEEITNYQTIIEENKDELINSSNTINDFERKLNDRENDIQELNEIINDLNRVVTSLQADNEKLSNFELMETQLGELKSALNKQIEQTEDYNEELERSNETISALNIQLEQMKDKILETEHEIEIKDTQLKEVATQLRLKDNEISNLQVQMTKKEERIHSEIEGMKQKYLNLQKNLDGNNEMVEKKVEELTNKNKEQLEKMKKIAANLKKKTQALQDLEEKYHSEKEKWAIDLDQKESLLLERANKITELTFTLEEVKVELQNTLLNARHKQEKINEVSLKQELSTSLHEEFDNTVEVDRNSVFEDKIKELEMIIETNESELYHYKERAQHLEECVLKLTEEKDMLYRQGSEIEHQSNEMTKNINEKILLETQLTEKLQQVESTCDELNKRLADVAEENRELNQKLKEQEELVTKLKIKLKKAHEKVTQLKSLQANIEDMEKANESLKKQLKELEANQKHNLDDQEASRQQDKLELEKIEADYQAQMAEVLDTKNSLMMDCERLNESLKESQEREAELLSELNEYKQKIEEIEADDASQIQKLSDELKSTTDNWRVAISQIENLSQQLEDIQRQIVFQSAQETVDNVLNKAVASVYEMNSVETQTEIFETSHNVPVPVNTNVLLGNVPTIQWNQDIRREEGPVLYQTNELEYLKNFEAKQSTGDISTPRVETSREQLMEKIKALEFLLYNIDKEKEEVVKECTGMVNELTRLIFEKVTKIDGAEPPLPSDLESQILKSEDIVDATNNRALQEIEFTKCDPNLGQQSQLVFEEVIQPKQAYVTYQPNAAEAFGENDDGWGWGPEEARLEEEHIQKTESTPQVEALKVEIVQLQARMQASLAERDGYLEEIKQLQAKSGKLLKKCKELKLKNDQLIGEQKTSRKTEGSEFFDLDATIQEELKSQMAQLEKRLKEGAVELEKEKLEKAKLLKQCEVLGSANDRMVELKEIQDSEVLRWKRKCEEIEERLQKQDWNSDGFAEHEISKVEQKQPTNEEEIEELKMTLKELTIDNEELQALLNEQRQLRIDAEKSNILSKSEPLEEKIATLENQLSIKATEMETIVAEKQQMIDNLGRAIEEKETLLQQLVEKNSQLQTAFASLQNKDSDYQTEYKIQLEAVVNEKDASISNLKKSLDDANTIGETLTTQLEILNQNLKDLQFKYQELEETNSSLQNELDRERQSNNNLEVDLDREKVSKIQSVEQERGLFLEKENEYLLRISEMDKQIVNLQLLQDELQRILEKEKDELSIWQQKFEQLEITTIQVQEDLSRQQNLNDELKLSYSSKIDTLEKELSFYTQLGSSQQTNDSLLEEKDHNIKQLKLTIDDLNKQKLLLDEELQKTQEQLVESQKEYSLLESQLEEKLANAIQELELNWQEQVDERGNTVAESWKYHLNMVETEFASIKEKLKAEIDELETKCNALVNENNELRKNVDAEIRNEVDRVSAMQQQINERQHTIQELQKEIDSLKPLQQLILEKDNALTSLKLVVDTTQQQLEEKRDVVEEIVKILEKNAPWPLPCEKLAVIAEFERQLAVTSDKDQEITRLNARIVELQIQFNSSQEKEAEIFQLQQQIASLHEKEAEIRRLEGIESELQKMVFDLQTREDQETTRLNNIIEDFKVQLNEKQNQLSQFNEERTATIQTIEDYMKQCEELRVTYDQLQSAIMEKDQEIVRLKQQLEQVETLRNDNNKDVEQLHKEISQRKEELNIAHHSLADCQNQMLSVTQELVEKTNELQNNTQQMNYYLENCNRLEQELADRTNELQIVTQQMNNYFENSKKLEEEMAEMHKLINAKDQEYEIMKNSHSKDLESYYEEALSAKDIDREMLRTQLNEAVAMIEQYNGQLNNEIHAKSELELVKRDLELKLAEQATLLEEEHKQLAEMRILLEDQVVKIEDLKKELFQKSNDYDSLIAEMDIGRNTITQQPKSADAQTLSSTSQTELESARTYQEDDLSEPVSRAELDLALYMLHQRDVRCEELTVELTQLLEERDTLQLRLSNAIREKEEIRRRLTGNVLDTASVTPTSSQDPSTPQNKSSAIFLADSGTELATELTEEPASEKDLASKLSELKSVGYKKDKTFVDEQQIRRLQQMSIMQQHIQEASKLPPEAAAKLVDASYTLSRDVQSPSKVLLNWLWGRSTPKVNDT